MGKSFCELPLLFSTQTSEYEELQSTFITTFVLNSFLCYSAVMLNCVAIYAIRKTSSLPKTLKTLLLSVAVSDVGVGLLDQPFYISLLVMWLQQNDPGCNTYKALLMVSSLFCLASSQIPGTCDSQACCCCGDLNMGIDCIYLFHDLVGFIRYCSCCCSTYCSCVSPRYSCGLHQDLFGRTTPAQKSYSCSASTTSNREQRNNQFGQRR